MTVAMELREFIENEILDGHSLEGDPLEQGILDSLAVELLIDFVQTKYGVEFEDEELVAENFASLDQVAVLIEARRTRIEGGTLGGSSPDGITAGATLGDPRLDEAKVQE
jgi:acyl carrier protein